VHAGEVTVHQRHVADRGSVAGHEVDHPGGQTGGLEQAHRVMRGELLGRPGLPHHGGAYEGGRRREVAGDGGEVEGADGEHEALERTVVEPVPRPGSRLGLYGAHLGGEGHVEAPEVHELTGRVDLGLLHHTNGDRLDNRPENLELWSSWQPRDSGRLARSRGPWNCSWNTAPGLLSSSRQLERDESASTTRGSS